MVQIKPLEAKDCQKIIEWNSDKEQNHLYQWAGNKAYTYPLTVEQVINRLGEENTEIYKIIHNDEMVGSIELFNINKVIGSARICRFIIQEGSSEAEY